MQKKKVFAFLWIFSTMFLLFTGFAACELNSNYNDNNVNANVDKITYSWYDIDDGLLFEETINKNAKPTVCSLPADNDKWEYIEWREIEKSTDDKGYKAYAIPRSTYFAGNVFQIVIKDLGETPIATGSAFVFNRNGWFITNAHVMNDAYYAHAIFNIPNGKGESFTQLNILGSTYCHLDKDIYIGKIENYNSVKPYYREIPVNSSYEIGDETFSVGYPHSSAEIMINAGEVIGNWSDIYEKLYSGHSYICSSSFIAPGSSGGILTNDKLEVIGITTLGLLDENGGFLSGASISALNFYNYLQFTSEKDLIDLQKLFHKDETTYIAYFNKAKADAAEGCATKMMLDDGIVAYEYTWTNEGVNNNGTAYSSEKYIIVCSDGRMIYFYEIYWATGDKRLMSFYGNYSDQVGFSNFSYEFSYTYSSGNYYTISCDDINYSTNISLTLKRYEVGKKSYGYTVSEEDITYCKEQFNYMYEWFMEEIKNI